MAHAFKIKRKCHVVLCVPLSCHTVCHMHYACKEHLPSSMATQLFLFFFKYAHLSPPFQIFSFHIHHSFSHITLKYVFQYTFDDSNYQKKKPILFFSTVKPQKIQLWNTKTFEHFRRSLIRWLDREIADGKRIRRIDKLVTYQDWKIIIML